MATDRSAGTEIVCSNLFEAIPGGANYDLIYGAQYHIYTVLSISLFANTVGATSHYFDVVVKGYDAYGSDTASSNRLFRWYPQEVAKTFVWNDRFAFNGHEPTDWTGNMDSVADQNAIVDQASGVAQRLQIGGSDAGSKVDVIVTFIDQNNAE